MFFIFAVLLFYGCGPKNMYVDLPMDYTEPDSPDFKNHQKSSEYIEMPDGVKIAVDVFLPSEGPAREKFPVILSYTPYQRSRIDRQTGVITDFSSEYFSRELLARGYALVCADIRGTGASTGWLLDFMPEIWSDGKEVVDWIANQSWSNGNVGMMGGSYLGWSQLATASHAPAALKCIMPTVVPLEGYTGEVYPGGIYLDGFMKNWSGFMYHTVRNYYLPDLRVTTTPVIDEDNDGDLLDEIPLDLNSDGSFLDEGYPPSYSDSSVREHIYYNMTLEHHEKNYDYTEWTRDMFFYDAQSPLGYRVDQLGPTAFVERIKKSKIPVYNVGGWFDGFARGTAELYCTMKESNPSKMILGPGYHDVAGGPFWKLFGYDFKKARQIYLMEHVRFFDRYLKEIKNGLDREPPILIYVMNGKGWRFENEWPLKRQIDQRFYFGAAHSLVKETETGQDEYKVDYSHNSSYGPNDGNRWLGIGGNEPNSLPFRDSLSDKTLNYQTKPVDAEMEVTGHPMVYLSLSSTAEYGDVFVYLEDVDEQGKSLLVTEGQLRAGFNGLYDNDDMVPNNSGLDILPDIPWHGFKKDQYVERVFANNSIVNLKIDLAPTSWVFKTGHRIRLSIAGSDYPTFRLHPQLCPGNGPESPTNILPTMTLHYGPEYEAFIDLPVIPNTGE